VQKNAEPRLSNFEGSYWTTMTTTGDETHQNKTTAIVREGMTCRMLPSAVLVIFRAFPWQIPVSPSEIRHPVFEILRFVYRRAQHEACTRAQYA
jgi:hypothetical protein